MTLKLNLTKYGKEIPIMHKTNSQPTGSENTKGAIRNRISKNIQHNKEKAQKDKQRSTKHTYKAKGRVT